MDEPISNLPEKEHSVLLTIDGDTDSEEPCMFERVVYLFVFYCLCYVKQISMDMLEEQVSDETYLDQNEKEYIRMEDSREQHWRDVAKDGEDKIKVHALRQDVYTK